MPFHFLLCASLDRRNSSHQQYYTFNWYATLWSLYVFTAYCKHCNDIFQYVWSQNSVTQYTVYKEETLRYNSYWIWGQQQNTFCICVTESHKWKHTHFNYTVLSAGNSSSFSQRKETIKRVIWGNIAGTTFTLRVLNSIYERWEPFEKNSQI